MKKTNSDTASMDKMRYVVAIALIVFSMFGYYWFADLDLALRILMIIVGGSLAVFAVWASAFGVDTRKHLSDTHREVKQVVWPTRDQAVRMTLIVFVAVFLVGLFLWLIDMFFLWGVQTLSGRGV